MLGVRFSEDVRPISDLRHHTAEVVDQACSSKRPILLTRRGRGVAVLLGLDEYERLVNHSDATLEGLCQAIRSAAPVDPDFAKDLERIRAEQPPMKEDAWDS